MYYNVRARLKRLNKQAQERANNTVSPQVLAEVEAYGGKIPHPVQHRYRTNRTGES